MSEKQMQTHVIERTSPKGPGSPFIGTCRLCGRTGLPASAALEPCENVRGVSVAEAMVEVVIGNDTAYSTADPAARRYRLREAIRETLNRHSAENGSDTPDWILADHLMACLDAFNNTNRDRENWYGRTQQPITIDGPKP